MTRIDPVKRLVAAALQRRRAAAFASFARACEDPAAAQERALTALMTRLSGTAVARRLGLTHPRPVRSVAELRERVPLTRYDDYRPELERALTGVPNQLTPGRPDLFAITSGTSGHAKHIPIDEAYRETFQRPMQHYLYGLAKDHPAAFSGSVLYLVGPTFIGLTPGHTPIGSISGHNLRRLSPLLRRFSAIPHHAFDLSDLGASTWAQALFALRREISFAVSITTHPLALLGETLRDHADALLRDLSDGTFFPFGRPSGLAPGDPSALGPPGTLAALRAQLRPEPRRARLLSRRAAAAGALTPASAWPTLALLSCWWHASAGSHLALLPALYGAHVPIRTAVYSATEGWLNVPRRDRDASDPSSASGVLAIESGVFELERLGPDLDTGLGETLLPHEAEPGQDYGLVLSSGCGLWRYRLGDRVRVTGFFGRTPELHYVQKLGQTMSLAHDMTSEDHVRTALTNLTERFGITRWVFGPGAPDGLRPRYRLAVQLADHSSGPDLAPLAAAFDAALSKANMGYGADREADILAPCEVLALSAQDFAAWDEARKRTLGPQSKTPTFVKEPPHMPTPSSPPTAP